MKELVIESKRVLFDIAGAIRDICTSKPLDPRRFAEAPPAWWHKKAEKPEAEPPKKKERRANAHEVFDSVLWLEVMAMSDDEWKAKYGTFSAIRWSDKYQSHQNQRFANREEMLDWIESERKEVKSTPEVDFDAEAQDELTRRECGELLAYVPRLDDFELAAKVKRLKAQGVSLKAISERTGKPYQTIKHYSSALGKGQN